MAGSNNPKKWERKRKEQEMAEWRRKEEERFAALSPEEQEAERIEKQKELDRYYLRYHRCTEAEYKKKQAEKEAKQEALKAKRINEFFELYNSLMGENNDEV